MGNPWPNVAKATNKNKPRDFMRKPPCSKTRSAIAWGEAASRSSILSPRRDVEPPPDGKIRQTHPPERIACLGRFSPSMLGNQVHSRPTGALAMRPCTFVLLGFFLVTSPIAWAADPPQDAGLQAAIEKHNKELEKIEKDF